MTQSTSLSLLARLRSAPEEQDWRRFVGLYEPLLRSWLRRREVQDADADDLVQNALAVMVRRLPDFEHNGRPGAFRTWLRSVTVNCLREHWRRRQARPGGVGGSDILLLLNELEDPTSQQTRQWEEEHDRHVMRRLLEELRDEFEPRTWQAFERFALAGESAATVARELDITPNAVFIAKSRVLARLREEAAGLLDDLTLQNEKS